MVRGGGDLKPRGRRGTEKPEEFNMPRPLAGNNLPPPLSARDCCSLVDRKPLPHNGFRTTSGNGAAVRNVRQAGKYT